MIIPVLRLLLRWLRPPDAKVNKAEQGPAIWPFVLACGMDRLRRLWGDRYEEKLEELRADFSVKSLSPPASESVKASSASSCSLVRAWPVQSTFVRLHSDASHVQHEQESLPRSLSLCTSCGEHLGVLNEKAEVKECGHVFCQGCLETHVLQQLRERKAPVTCPAAGCTALLPRRLLDSIVNIADLQSALQQVRVSHEVRSGLAQGTQGMLGLKCGLLQLAMTCAGLEGSLSLEQRRAVIRSQHPDRVIKYALCVATAALLVEPDDPAACCCGRWGP